MSDRPGVDVSANRQQPRRRNGRRQAPGRRVASRIRGPGSLNAPELLIIECIQVIRREVQRGRIDADLGTSLVNDLLALDIEFYDH